MDLVAELERDLIAELDRALVRELKDPEERPDAD